VFLNHPYTETITLVNVSAIKAKYIIHPQSEESKVLAEYSTDRDQGEIAPKEFEYVQINLKTKSTGTLSLNFRIDILGSEPQS